MSPARRKRLPKRPKMSVQQKYEEKDRFGSSQVAILATVRRFGRILGQKLGIGMTRDDPKSVSKAEAGGRVLLRRLHTSAESVEFCFNVSHACQGAAD